MNTKTRNKGYGQQEHVHSRGGVGSESSPTQDELWARVGGSEGREVIVGLFGELMAEKRNFQVAGVFGRGIPLDWESVTPAGSTVAVTNGVAILTADGANLPYLQSRRSLRCWPGATSGGGGTIMADVGTVEFWAGDTVDGFCITVNETDGITKVARWFDGVETATLAEDFNGHDLSAIDGSKLNVVLILWGFFGIAGPSYFVMDPDSYALLMIHVDHIQGKTKVPHIGTPDLPITVRALDNSVAGTASASAFVMGGADSANLERVPGTFEITQAMPDNASEHVIEVFRFSEQFNGKRNPVSTEMTASSKMLDADVGIMLTLYVGLADCLTGAPVLNWLYTDTGTATEGASQVEYSSNTLAELTAGVDLTAMRRIHKVPIAGIKNTVTVAGGILKELGLEGYRGAYIAVTARRILGTAGYNLISTESWGELQ